MKPPQRPATEVARLAALRTLDLLDTSPEAAYDDIVAVASHVFGTPIALTSLVDAERQWFKARVGLPVEETPRAVSFCGHAILAEDVFIVPDARADERFADNPLVTGEPRIRFYAGAQLTVGEGHNVGTLCVIGTEPKTPSEEQLNCLKALARQVVRLIEARNAARELRAALDEVRLLASILPICSHCRQVRNDDGYWREVEAYLATATGARFSHSICPPCLREHYPDLAHEVLEQTD